jgi:hypothetical protein
MELWYLYHYWLANHYLLLRDLRVKHRNIKNAEDFKKLIKHKSRIVCWQHYTTLRYSQRVFIILVCLLDTKCMRYTGIVKFHLVARQRNWPAIFTVSSNKLQVQ